jgi:hypothetical protein
MTTVRLLIVAALTAAAAGWTPLTAQQPSPAPLAKEETRARNLRAYVELLRSDLRTQKVALLTELMQLTEQEDAAFWPVYRQYELEVTRLNDERLAGIERYAEVYTRITDADAHELATQALELESRRADLKKKYYARLKSALSPVRAARALQIENQIQALVDLQVAASLPVLE